MAEARAPPLCSALCVVTSADVRYSSMLSVPFALTAFLKTPCQKETTLPSTVTSPLSRVFLFFFSGSLKVPKHNERRREFTSQQGVSLQSKTDTTQS